MCQCVRYSREVVIPKSKMAVTTVLKVKEFVLPSVIHFVRIKHIHGYIVLFIDFFKQRVENYFKFCITLFFYYFLRGLNTIKKKDVETWLKIMFYK